MTFKFPSIASHVHIHSFKYLRTEKQVKDGGVFVTFSFVPPEEGEGPREKALQEIQEALFKAAEGQGGLKTWSYSGSAKIWRVLGRPWHEVRRTLSVVSLRLKVIKRGSSSSGHEQVSEFSSQGRL